MMEHWNFRFRKNIFALTIIPLFQNDPYQILKLDIGQTFEGIEAHEKD